MTPTTHPTWKAWAGLIAAPAAWALHHQLMSDLNYANCEKGNGVLTVVSGLFALALALGGGVLSVYGWRDAEAAASPGGKFIGLLSVLVVGLHSVTLMFQILAGAIVPACFR